VTVIVEDGMKIVTCKW